MLDSESELSDTVDNKKITQPDAMTSSRRQATKRNYREILSGSDLSENDESGGEGKVVAETPEKGKGKGKARGKAKKQAKGKKLKEGTVKEVSGGTKKAELRLEKNSKPKELVAEEVKWHDIPEWGDRKDCPLLTLPNEVLDRCFAIRMGLSVSAHYV